MKRIIRGLLHLFYIFPVNRKKIFLTSFDGTKYGFDSKAMVQYIEKKYPGQYRLIWGTKTSGTLETDGWESLEFVKIKSLRGIYHIMTSGAFIYNINPPSYIPYRKSQKLINTWHGFAYKKVGRFAPHFDERQFNDTTCFLSHGSEYSRQVIKDSMMYKGVILECGVPRNDIFFSAEAEKAAEKIRRYYGVAEDEHLVLFAPTFRNMDSYTDGGLDVSGLLHALAERFGGSWRFLYRLHPMIISKHSVSYPDGIDVSAWPDMQELLCAADVLVTDYSSSMWDFSLQRKPVIAFASDIDEYEQNRGLYHSFSEWPFLCCRTNEEIYEAVRSYDAENYIHRISSYFTGTGCADHGHACEKVMDVII